MTEAEIIAGRLSKWEREAMLTDPQKLEGFVGSLIGLCLDDLAAPREDNSVFLTPLGLAVRQVLQERGE